MRNENGKKPGGLSRASMIVACIALFAAIGGSAYAAKGLITGKQIAKNTITAKNIKKGTIKKKNLNKKTIKSLKGQKGPQGPQGPQGVAGADGVVEPEYLAEDTFENVAADTEETILTQNVPSGQYVVNAKTNVFAQGAGIGNCSLVINGEFDDDAQFNETAGSVNTRNSLPLQTVTPPGTTSIAVSCGTQDTAISVSRVSIIAIPVG
jgi:hypothetical protein